MPSKLWMAIFMFHGKRGSSIPLLFRGAMTEEQNDAELLKYRRCRHHRIPESI